jgi:hypothetical protein
MSKFCNDKKSYIRPIELFFKHQENKLACSKLLDELNMDSNVEFVEFRGLINDKLDRKIEAYDKEICYRNLRIFNQVKKSALDEYTSYMEQNVRI